MLRQNTLRDLADYREPGAETVIALGLVKGLEQFGLLDAYQLAGFLLDIPNPDVREDLKRRAVTALKKSGPSGHTAQPPRRAAEKAHQAICFAQGKWSQDDG